MLVFSFMVNRKHCEARLQRKKYINFKYVFVTHSLCPYYRFLWVKCQDLQMKGRISQFFFLSWSCCDNKSNWKQSGNQDTSWRKLDSIPGMCPRFCVTDYFFFHFVIVTVNFRLYTNPWQTIGAVPWEKKVGLKAGSFGYKPTNFGLMKNGYSQSWVEIGSVGFC